MSFCRLGPGPAAPEEFNVVIEIPAYSDPVKYEVKKEEGLLFVDRFLSVSMRYPLNYGYIPGTFAGDGDPVDVLVLTPFPLVHACVLSCRSVGLLNMDDESGHDVKIIALPNAKSAPMYAHFNDIDDIPQTTKDEVVHFFEHYKDLEKGKWVKVSGWECKEAADQIIRLSIIDKSSHR